MNLAHFGPGSRPISDNFFFVWKVFLIDFLSKLKSQKGSLGFRMILKWWFLVYFEEIFENNIRVQGKQNFMFTFCYSWLIDSIHIKQLRSSKIRWVDPIIMLQQLTTQIKLPSSDECNQKFFEGCSNWLTLFLTVSKLYLGAILPPAAGERIHDSWRIG